jgi:serine carboxypeptidase 1
MSLRGVVAALLAAGAAAQTFKDQWGYVDVRPGAHSFWWLYASPAAPQPAPVIMWLQGGPGASSTGFGNFEEIGPLDVSLQPRNTTWLSLANLLFVDNPVGTGYSYVDDLSKLTTTNAQIADDLVALMVNLTQTVPGLATAPFYVFCESYGGKMTAQFAQALLAALDAKRLSMNFKGVALGDSWISPVDFVDTWAPFLRVLSVLDEHEKTTVIDPDVAAVDAAVAAGQWVAATNYWSAVEGDIEATTDGIDFYNVLLHNAPDAVSATASQLRMTAAAAALAPEGIDAGRLAALYRRHVAARYGDALSTLMNGAIRQKLGVIPASVTWGGQSNAVRSGRVRRPAKALSMLSRQRWSPLLSSRQHRPQTPFFSTRLRLLLRRRAPQVFSALSGDFMRPVVDVVDGLLKDGRISVTIYEGQLDLICATVGAERWMRNLTWPGMAGFNAAAKTPLYPTAGSYNTGGFVKHAPPLSYYTIMDAGHMVPADNGPMALQMVAAILAGK